MDSIDAVNLALLAARVWVGAVMLIHGWNHIRALRAGPGMANWLTGLGLSHGKLQALMLTWAEVGVGPLLVLGVLTPLAYGGAASLMLVAWITNHRDKGFFITARPTEGWEYVATLAVLSLALGALGPGEWALDEAIEPWTYGNPARSLAVAAIVGLGGTAAYLLAFWRPRRASS